MTIDFNETIKSGVEQAMKECELTIGMTLKECVEKQTPKKMVKYSYGHTGEIIFECPNCKTRYNGFYEGEKYCIDCGQKLDWSEDQ